MRDRLAQRLLAAVMGWEQERLNREQDLLQTLAAYKYDAYENFEPGVKFVESLAQWLTQFDSRHREIAYRFVRERLIFVSAAEMAHLVRSMYPDVIRPRIREIAAQALGCSPHLVRRIEASAAYEETLRRSLFLGLSDGARIDAFRRSSPDLDNEQVHTHYEMGEMKLVEMQRELGQALQGFEGTHEGGESAEPSFRQLFLLDDFAGTGTTMIRRKDGSWSGRLKKISDQLLQVSDTGVFDLKQLRVYVCLYMITEQALEHFETELRAFESEGASWGRCEILYLQVFRYETAIHRGQDAELDAFLDHYYSPELEDKKSYKVGGKGIEFGYGACGLPLVIHHNTPNNSLFVLWKDGTNEWRFTPLFRRFERHRKLVDDEAQEDESAGSTEARSLPAPTAAEELNATGG